MRLRRQPNDNYAAVFNEAGTFTLRCPIDISKPILPLHYPELEDVSLGTLCDAGCPQCYAGASGAGVVYTEALQHILDYYGGLEENDRPFQVAIGGGGEPTLHPDFPEILGAYRSLGIVPNYTTNGMNLTPDILEATRLYAGGVAVSCHQHLEPCWEEALTALKEVVNTSLHIIVGEQDSAARFWDIYDRTHDVDYYVALPYKASGRAIPLDVGPEWDGFFTEALTRKPSDISFGAGFYDYLMEHGDVVRELRVDIYEPEVLSGYRMLDDSYQLLRRSSYDLEPKFPQEEVS